MSFRVCKILLSAGLFLLLPSFLFAADLKNERFSLAGERVVFEFDVTGEPGESAEVDLTITIDGKSYTSNQLYLEGDYGRVRTGQGKEIIWNVLKDFPGGLKSGFDWELKTGRKTVKDDLTGMRLVLIKGGCYRMGDTYGDGDNDEKPVHEVCLDDFYIGKYEVTQGEYKTVMGYNPSRFGDCGSNCPVEQVNWNDAQEFIQKLNEKEGAKRFRLPTEAEWEYAARGGSRNEKYSGTNNEAELGDYAWYNGNAENRTHIAGMKKPNGTGLYDMSGNVWEWVSDLYDNEYYAVSSKKNPEGPVKGEHHVLRGGSWNYDARDIRAANRVWGLPDFMSAFTGFRIAKTP